MCMVSNIGDDYADKFPAKWPNFYPPQQPYPHPSGVSDAEFEALKKEVRELKKLLKAAKEYDDATGQPDCEMEEKVKLIKAIAELVGVDLGEVFGPKEASS
jgi:hypothetical protein